MVDKNYPLAIKHYSEAININPENHILYSNRSLAYFESKDYELSLKDALKCIELDEDFVKGHFRKGCVLFELKRFQEALGAFTHAHDLCPKDEEIISFMEKSRSEIV